MIDARAPHPVRLADVARELPGAAGVDGDGAVVIDGVRHDSRRVERGDLFVVRKGASHDASAFVGDAIARGAVALLAKRGTSLDARGLPVVWVDDVAVGMAYAAAAVYGHPSFGLDVVGVTGTNGKTTTTHLVRAAIDGAAEKTVCGLVGTVGYKFGDLDEEPSHTTPESDELARVMLAMKRKGAGYVAMEVSSIALELARVAAVRFSVAAFTNLTQDHLDFHGSMEAYAAAKRRLFVECAPGNAVVNVDDAEGRALSKLVRSPLVTVSAKVGADADVAPLSSSLDARGVRARLRSPAGELELASPLVGAHNLENLVVALGVVIALGLDARRACAALAGEKGAPGRLERCDGPGDDVTALVDYAHTPDALARVLDAIRAVTKARVLCVFGCGGDRDPKKRGPMGRAVGERADVAIVTSDNPRTEDPAAIAEAAAAGVRDAGMGAIDPKAASSSKGFFVELDRARAIRAAALAARPGDVVLVAGKGHEDYQIVGTEKRAFDDRAVVRAALAERRGEGTA